jgi:tryptophan halogenase
LIQSGIAKLIELFPDRDMDNGLRDRFNARFGADMDAVKDLLLLHYHATTDKPEPFWVERRAMPLPATLVAREQTYRRSGRLLLDDHDVFREASWLAVLNGQGIVAEHYDPLADTLDADVNRQQIAQAADQIRRAAMALPLHDVALANELNTQ